MESPKPTDGGRADDEPPPSGYGQGGRSASGGFGGRSGGGTGAFAGGGVTSGGAAGQLEVPTELAQLEDCAAGVRLTAQGQQLYLSVRASGKIQTVPLAGGALEDVATSQSAPTWITSDQAGVYWVNQGDKDVPGRNQVMKQPLPLAVEDPIVLESAVGAAAIPAIAVLGGALYYVSGHQVHEVSLGDSGNGDVIVGLGEYVSDDMPPQFHDITGALAVNDHYVAWSAPGITGVESHPRSAILDLNDTSGFRILGRAYNILDAGDLSLDAKFAYWADENMLQRGDPDQSGISSEIITTSPDGARLTAFALGDAMLYAATASGSIFEHSVLPPPDSSDPASVVPPLIIAQDQGRVLAMLAFRNELYWVSEDCRLRSLEL
jgi:hypothetical protein